MKNRFLAAVMVGLPIAVFVFLCWYFAFGHRPATPDPPTVSTDSPAGGSPRVEARPNASQTGGASPAAFAPENAVAAVPLTLPSGAPAPVQFTNFAPAIVLENVRTAIRQYSQEMGGNPVGTNPEITAALAGDNPKHLHFLDSEAGLRVNAAGEMIDPWGSPLFFHQLSATVMEIRSAGPDRILWTADDLVVK